jgi:hypothetical protein
MTKKNQFVAMPNVFKLGTENRILLLVQVEVQVEWLSFNLTKLIWALLVVGYHDMKHLKFLVFS